MFPDFSGKGPPTLCGWDVDTGEDKFCCKDLDSGGVSMPQPPLFPDKDTNEARPCRDHSKECPKWAKKKPDSCHPSQESPESDEFLKHSYEFMREGCMESCGRCGNDVRFLLSNLNNTKQC